MNGWYLTNGKYIPLYFAVFKIMQSVIRVWSIRYTHLTEITQFFPNNIVGWIVNFPSSGKPFCFFFFNWKGAENRSATHQNLILTRNAIFRKKKLRPFLYDCTFLIIIILAKVFSLWHIKERRKFCQGKCLDPSLTSYGAGIHDKSYTNYF